MIFGHKNDFHCSVNAFGEESGRGFASWVFSRGRAAENMTEKSHLSCGGSNHTEKFLVCVPVWNRSHVSHPHAKTSFNLPKGNYVLNSSRQTELRVDVAGLCGPRQGFLLPGLSPSFGENPPGARSDSGQVESQPWFTEQKTSLAGSQLRICPGHTREIFRLKGCQPKQ